MPIHETTDGVAADMERIFKPLTGRAIVPAFHHDRDDRRGHIGRGWQRLTLAAPALVLLVTAVLATGYGLADRPAERAKEVASAARLPRARVATAVTPPSAPALSVPVPALTTPSAAATSSGASAVNPRAPATDAPASIAETPATGNPDAAEALPARAPVRRPDMAAQPEPRREVAEARPVAPARERADPAPTVPQCTPGSLEDRCIYQDVLQADTKLRLVYDRAKQEGVSKLWLSAVARRWIRVREDAEEDPDGAIRRYGRLADALDEERRRVVR